MMQVFRSHIPLLAAILSLVILQPGILRAQSQSLARKPNVVIILVDDMGFSDPGCFGGEISTPNIDKLARGGLRFTQFYNAGRCWPTRSSLLSGYYANAIGMDPVIRDKASPAWVTTIPSYLKKAGYRSYHSGKYHVMNNKPPVSAGGFDQSYWIERGSDFYYDFTHYFNDKALAPFTPEDSTFCTTVITDQALGLLEQHEKDYGDRPFFLYLAYRAPHFPLMARQADIDRYKERYLEGWDALRVERWNRMHQMGLVNHALPDREEGVNQTYEHLMKDEILLDSMTAGEVLYPLAWESLTPEEKNFQALKMSIHAAMVDRVDQEIGRVLEHLSQNQELENTVIFFLSDNGASAEIMIRGNGHNRSARAGSSETYLCLGPGWAGASNTPFRRYKSWTHEGGIATPLIVHWPRGIKDPGSLRKDPGHVVDFLPTLLDLAGLEPETTKDGIAIPPLHGISLLPAFEKEGALNREFIYFNHHGAFAGDAVNRALRMGDWKIVASGTDNHGWELYNLETDRGERIDLSGGGPDQLDSMVKRWKEADAYYRELSKNDE